MITYPFTLASPKPYNRGHNESRHANLEREEEAVHENASYRADDLNVRRLRWVHGKGNENRVREEVRQFLSFEVLPPSARSRKRYHCLLLE